jgi:preprotein translocase subunit YajC
MVTRIFSVVMKRIVLASTALGASALVYGQDAAAPAVPAGTPAATGAPAMSAWANMVPLLLMFGVFYFLMIRPQQKKMKEQQAMLSALQQGDQVLTQSGLIGKVFGIQDKVVTVEIADNVKVKMLKSQVTQVIKGQIGDIA